MVAGNRAERSNTAATGGVPGNRHDLPVDSDIGQRLFVSEGTTKTHVSNVLTKLHLRDRVQAVIFAYENGVVTPGEDQPRG